MNNKQPRFFYAVLALWLLLGLSSVQAQDTVHQRLKAGWVKATDLIDGVLSPAQRSEMNSLAFSAAVASLCEGFDLNRDKFTTGMKTLEHENKAEMSAEQIDYFETHLTFNYGVAVGLYLAEGSLDQAGFCAEAAAHRNDPESHLHYWE